MFKMVARPVVNLWVQPGCFSQGMQIGTQHTPYVGGQKGKYVPQAVKIGETDGQPEVTVDSITQPDGDGNHQPQYCKVAESPCPSVRAPTGTRGKMYIKHIHITPMTHQLAALKNIFHTASDKTGVERGSRLWGRL